MPSNDNNGAKGSNFIAAHEEGRLSSSSSTAAPQASLPQASSNGTDGQQKKEEEKRAPIKLKFTLSTLTRKYDEGDLVLTSSDENGDAEEGEIEEGEEGVGFGSAQESFANDFKGKNRGNPDIQTSSTPTDVASETASSLASLTPVASKGTAKDEEEGEVVDPQESNEDVAMEDNDEESMEYGIHHKNNGFGGFNHGNDVKAEEPADAEMTPADGDDKSQENDSIQDKDSQEDAGSISEMNNRPTRTRSSYESTKDAGDRESVSNEDTRAKNDASIDNNNEVKSTNTYSTTSRSALLSDRDNIGFRDPPSSATTVTSSFLDSLSEEQRRVRVRHLPNISGFRRLHKSEIKRDVSSIKKMLKKAEAKGGWKSESTDDERGNDADNMDVDGNVAQVSGEETPSDDEESPAPKRGKDEDIYNVFSLPFIQSPYICTDVDGQYSNPNSEQDPHLFSSPQVVESISAFNPPRPPESVGPKKMHRLHRWERNPQDVEIDLTNYRKTVNRTRQELHKAEMERERIEVTGAHLRSHFVTLLKCMRREMDLLNQQYDATQIQCVKAAELLTSKTRSRGAARGSYVMKDVISVLKSRGEKLNLNGENILKSKESPWCVPGIGGLCHDENTTEVGCGWLLPGDKVSSPCGVGIVEQIYGPTPLGTSTANYSNDNETKPPQSQMPQSQHDSLEEDSAIVSSRVRVKLPFGVGYFVPSALTLLSSSSLQNDEKLGARWTSMLESAKKMRTITDHRSVDNYISMEQIAAKAKQEGNNNADDDMTESSTLPDIINADEGVNDLQVSSSISFDAKKKKMVSCGGGLLPLTKNVAPNVNLEQMEKNVKMLVKGSSGVLGVRENKSVPSGFRIWEDNREELRTLEGQATQLRNKVYRQKRIRYLNESSCNSNKDRSDRFELLLTEMKADLNILKKRLNEELVELGIDQLKAEELLAEHQELQGEDEEIRKELTHGVKRKRDEETAKSSRQKVEQYVVKSTQ